MYHISGTLKLSINGRYTDTDLEDQRGVAAKHGHASVYNADQSESATERSTLSQTMALCTVGEGITALDLTLHRLVRHDLMALDVSVANVKERPGQIKAWTQRRFREEA